MNLRSATVFLLSLTPCATMGCSLLSVFNGGGTTSKPDAEDHYAQAKAIAAKGDAATAEEIASGRKHADQCRLDMGSDASREMQGQTVQPVATVDGKLSPSEVHKRCREFDAAMLAVKSSRSVDRATGVTPVQANALAQKLVVERLEGFSHEDSMRLDRVAEAFEHSKAADLAAVVAADGDYRPASFAPRWFDRIVEEDDRLDVHGVRVALGRSVIAGTYLRKPARLEPGTPGLVWSEGKSRSQVWFVTLDGGRYVVDKKNLGDYDASAPVPEGPRNVGLAPMEVYWLSKADAIPAKQNDTLKSIESKFEACAAPMYRSTKKKIADLEARYLPSDRRQELSSAEWAKLDRRIAKKCGHYGPKYRKALTKIVDGRIEARTKLRQRTEATLGNG
ncbi:MAG: hypothetical protein AAF721_15175 [Myxococcota bacterium]